MASLINEQIKDYQSEVKRLYSLINISTLVNSISDLDQMLNTVLEKIIEFHGEKSHFVLPCLLREDRIFDFGFIDGCHLFDYFFLDLFYLGQLIKIGGIIFMDDYDRVTIRKAASFFVKNLDWKIEEKGSYKKREWLVLRTSKKQDTRDWKYFIDF